jgi:enoyl-CoA hydratase/carnithine racemase
MPKVLYDKRDRIAYVTINRPDAKNAIDPETHDLLVATTTRSTSRSSRAPATPSARAPT